MRIKGFSFIIMLLIFSIIFVIAGKYDTQINKENAINNSITESNKQYSLLSDTSSVNAIYESLSDSQIAEAIYNTNRETFDTIYKVNIVETYLINSEYYNSIPNCGNLDYLKTFTVL